MTLFLTIYESMIDAGQFLKSNFLSNTFKLRRASNVKVIHKCFVFQKWHKYDIFNHSTKGSNL